MSGKKHSILGASGAHRWLICPGSIRVSAGMPNISSEYAMEGTAAHQLAEGCLRVNKDAVDYLGTEIIVQKKTFTVTEEMTVAVQVFLDAVRADLMSVGDGADLLIEHKFKLDWLYPGLYGTNDAMVGEPFGILRVYDFKYGAGVVVDAEDNVQMMYYALGAARGDAYEEVELVIVQPRAEHSEGPVRRCRMKVSELMRWADEVLLPGAKATEAEDAPLVLGEYCRFCPALAVCPSQQERAMVVAAEVFGAVPIAPPSPESMSPERLRKVLDVASLVETWFAACRTHARNLLETGAVSSEELGYKFVVGRASRSWKSEQEAAVWLEALLGKEEAYSIKLLSVSQAEKALKGPGKKALEEMVEVVRGKQMVPNSDKREPLAIEASAAFGEVSV